MSEAIADALSDVLPDDECPKLLKLDKIAEENGWGIDRKSLYFVEGAGDCQGRVFSKGFGGVTAAIVVFFGKSTVTNRWGALYSSGKFPVALVMSDGETEVDRYWRRVGEAERVLAEPERIQKEVDRWMS